MVNGVRGRGAWVAVAVRTGKAWDDEGAGRVHRASERAPVSLYIIWFIIFNSNPRV